MLKPSSFSQKVKSDLLKWNLRSPEEVEAETLTAFLCAGKSPGKPGGLPELLTTSSAVMAERMVGNLRAIGFDALAEKTVGEKNARWYVYPLSVDTEGSDDFRTAVSRFLREETADRIGSVPAVRRAALRGAFLTCGSMSEPQVSYRVEFQPRDKAAARLIILFLHAENISVSVTEKAGRPMVYFKEGESAARFLAVTGAHASLLRFENIRVDKELRNQVNRVVNCDTANACRQADASARQIERIEALLLSDANGRIPPELREAAQVRVDNPGLSVRDIGLLMHPPIGKSGMHHRLRRLEEITEEFENENLPHEETPTPKDRST